MTAQVGDRTPKPNAPYDQDADRSDRYFRIGAFLLVATYCIAVWAAIVALIVFVAEVAR